MININSINNIVLWLKLFGIKISTDELQGDVLPSFANGVMLMDIIEKLDKKS
jgi:hypothetical protein